MSQRTGTRMWFARAAVVAVLTSGVARADGVVTYTVQQDVAVEAAPAARAAEAEAPKGRGDGAAAKPVVDEEARAIRVRYSKQVEDRGPRKQ
jgi:hypothetical protein